MNKLMCREEDNKIIWSFYRDDELIVNYYFLSKDIGSSVGKRLVKVTLCRFAVMDLLNTKYLYIDDILYDEELTYLQNELNSFKDQSENYFQLNIPFEDIKVKSKPKKFNRKPMNSDECFLGYTGGKDSTLTYDLIKNDFKKINRFKIDFDDEYFSNQYKIAYEVINHNLYKKYSTREYYLVNNKKYYQEEDLHTVFAAPYFSMQEKAPANLALGIPWDNINSHVYKEYNSKEKTSEYVLAETYESILRFKKLMHYYGFIEFEIFSPLASLNSFAIYNILRKKHGSKKLKKLISCWTPINGEPCGKCIKCQRVSYIYKYLNIELNPKEEESIQNRVSKLDLLFGSISIKNILESPLIDYINISNVLLIDPQTTVIDRGYHKKIHRLYGLQIIDNPFYRK